MTHADAERQTLLQGASALGIDLSTAQADALLTYRDLLSRWNRTYNLTAIRDPGQMVTHHLLDSLSLVAPMARHSGGAATEVLDVGSGAGLPGVVLAVVRPAWRVTCVDTVQKKAVFVAQAAAELRLANLTALHARVENMRAGPFDLITSRAFSTLDLLVTLTRHLLRAGGAWVAMKGTHPQGEIDALADDIDVFHVERLSVPGLDAERHLVWMRIRGTHAA